MPPPEPTTAVAEAEAPRMLPVRRPPLDAIKALERVVIEGNLAFLSDEERVKYYARVCESLGLNPLTRPFEYITLNNKLTLYVRKDATDQLRQLHSVSIPRLERERDKELELFTVTAYATDRYGREDSGMGVVAIKGLTGEGLANAMMKAETKAKRRATLSIVGLGWMDELEALDQRAVEVAPRQALASGIAERTARLSAAQPTTVPQEAAQAPVAPQRAPDAPVCRHPANKQVPSEAGVTCGECGLLLAERDPEAPKPRARARTADKPARAPRAKAERAPLQPGDEGYGNAKAHAVASERGLDHAAVHRIAADVLQIPEDGLAAFSVKDLSEEQWAEVIVAIAEAPVADDEAEEFAGRLCLQIGMGKDDDPWGDAVPEAVRMFDVENGDALSPAQWREFGIRTYARNPLP